MRSSLFMYKKCSYIIILLARCIIILLARYRIYYSMHLALYCVCLIRHSRYNISHVTVLHIQTVAEQVTEVRGGWGSIESPGSVPPEAEGNLDFMVPQTSLDWSISVKFYLTIIMGKKRQKWPIFAQNFSDERSIRVFRSYLRKYSLVLYHFEDGLSSPRRTEGGALAP